MRALLKLKPAGNLYEVMACSLVVAIAVAGWMPRPAFADLSSGPVYESNRPRLPEPQRPPEQRPPRQRQPDDRPPLGSAPPPRDRDEWRHERRDEWRHREREREERREDWRRRQALRPPLWYGDIRYFDRYDLPRWRNGSWRFTWHNGELSWWWIVGGLWYPYVTPVYPYPDPYIPYAPAVIVQPEPEYTDSLLGVAPAPVAPMWYYCASAGGYYPYVSTCPEGWRAVPATPPNVLPQPNR